MAKLSARGRGLVGEIKGATWTKRYMDDGTILKNNGFGWKVHGHVKVGFTVEQAVDRAIQKQDQHLAANPAFAAYRKALIASCGLSKRWKLQTAISTCFDDSDAVWSEACDGYGDNVNLDHTETHKLCELFKAALAEKDAKATDVTEQVAKLMS